MYNTFFNVNQTALISLFDAWFNWDFEGSNYLKVSLAAVEAWQMSNLYTFFYVKKYLLNIIKNNMDYENTTSRKWQILSEKPRF